MRNRIKQHTTAKKKDIRPNPNNWRTHPQAQTDSLISLINSIGYVDELLVIDDPTGECKYLLVDGEARWSIANDNDDLPVSVLDITEAEANIVLATFDPISSFAGSEASKLDELMKDIDIKSFEDDMQKEMAKLLNRVDNNYGIPQLEAEQEWEGMPEYDNEDLESKYKVIVHFDTEEDIENFAHLVDQPITTKTKYIYYPAQEKQKIVGEQRFTADEA